MTNPADNMNAAAAIMMVLSAESGACPLFPSCSAFCEERTPSVFPAFSLFSVLSAIALLSVLAALSVSEGAVSVNGSALYVGSALSGC